MTTPTRASIYPTGWAAMTAKEAGKKYRPSNGSEGEMFFSAWCHHCDARSLCPIIGQTMEYNVEDDEYPEEWQYAHDGQPCCAAFVNADTLPSGTPRCDRTVDMFDGGAA